MDFEVNVRFTAEAIWGLPAGECQPRHYSSDPTICELDGIARLRDVTHLLMVTTSTKLGKVKDDVKKLNAAERIERRNASAVSKWLITERQLDAQHIDHARKNNVTILTLEQFKHRFFDGRSYIGKRELAPFGSARNPSDNSVTISDDAYIPLPMAVIERVSIGGGKNAHTEEKQHPVEVDDLSDLIIGGNVVVLLAPFGAGKSLTTREIFRTLTKRYLSANDIAVPACLNLREHWGQEYFDEMLERHARSIGFTPKEDLVAAWRAGLACLLLDGFDEVASQTIVRREDVNFMREARRSALAGVRDALTKLPSGIGALICGRDHYFDNANEMAHALGLPSRKFNCVVLEEFSDEGANEFLRKQGIDLPLPDWLPRKPLILSYLSQNDLLREILDIDAAEGYGYAWDKFIEKITERESELERAVMDSLTLRNVMERLAMSVRALPSGNGPITGSDLATAYNLETNQAAGEGVLAQLQRLPGLTQREREAGSRSFVDQDMLAALQGGALARYIWGQYEYAGAVPLTCASERSVNVAAYLVKRDGGSSAMALATVERLLKEADTPVNVQLASDCFAVAAALAGEEESGVDCRGIALEGALVGRLDLEDGGVSNIGFSNCVIDEVSVGPSTESLGIVFTNCIIGRVRGVASESGLPGGVFSEDCDVGEFDDVGTNNAVQQLDVAPQIKALLTVLRKLYRQAGAGRKKSALTRGITSIEVEAYVPTVVSELERQGFVRVFNQVVHPVRRNANRVEEILNAPSISRDPLIEAVREL